MDNSEKRVFSSVEGEDLDLIDESIDESTSDAGGFFQKGGALDRGWADIKRNVKDAGVSIKTETKKQGEHLQHAGKLLIQGRFDQLSKEEKARIKATAARTKSWMHDNISAQKAIHMANKLNPALITARSAFNAVLNLNVIGIATHIGNMKDKSPEHWNQLLEKWWLYLGGEKGEMEYRIAHDRKKPMLFVPILEKITGKKYSMDGEMSGADGANMGNVGKAIALAGTAIGTVGGVLATTVYGAPVGGYIAAGGGVLGAFGPIISSFAKANGASDADVAGLPPDATSLTTPSGIDNNGQFLDVNGQVMMGGDSMPLLAINDQGQLIGADTKPLLDSSGKPRMAPQYYIDKAKGYNDKGEKIDPLTGKVVLDASGNPVSAGDTFEEKTKIFLSTTKGKIIVGGAVVALVGVALWLLLRKKS
jgi:hypothetical protein